MNDEIRHWIQTRKFEKLKKRRCADFSIVYWSLFVPKKLKFYRDEKKTQILSNSCRKKIFAYLRTLRFFKFSFWNVRVNAFTCNSNMNRCCDKAKLKGDQFEWQANWVTLSIFTILFALHLVCMLMRKPPNVHRTPTQSQCRWACRLNFIWRMRRKCSGNGEPRRTQFDMPE